MHLKLEVYCLAAGLVEMCAKSYLHNMHLKLELILLEKKQAYIKKQKKNVAFYLLIFICLCVKLSAFLVLGNE